MRERERERAPESNNPTLRRNALVVEDDVRTRLSLSLSLPPPSLEYHLKGGRGKYAGEGKGKEGEGKPLKTTSRSIFTAFRAFGARGRRISPRNKKRKYGRRKKLGQFRSGPIFGGTIALFVQEKEEGARRRRINFSLKRPPPPSPHTITDPGEKRERRSQGRRRSIIPRTYPISPALSFRVWQILGKRPARSTTIAREAWRMTPLQCDCAGPRRGEGETDRGRRTSEKTRIRRRFLLHCLSERFGPRGENNGQATEEEPEQEASSASR